MPFLFKPFYVRRVYNRITIQCQVPHFQPFEELDDQSQLPTHDKKTAALGGCGNVITIVTIKEPLNKFRGSAAQGCAAIFQGHKALENGANRKSHFSIGVV